MLKFRETEAFAARKAWRYGGLAALTLVALGLRLWHLGRFELWVDEAATWWFARLAAAGRIGEQMALEPTPPLYYTLEGLWMRLAGESDLAMRLPSAFLGALTVPAVYFLGRTLRGQRAGWIAALLLAFHPLHVFYSREARAYPLLLLLCVLALAFFWRALESDSRRLWWYAGGLLLLACYAHFYALFLLAALGLAALLLAPTGRARWRAWLVLTLVGLGFAPYLWLTLPQLRGSGAAWSVEQLYRDFPAEGRLGRTLEMLWIGADYHPHLRQLDLAPPAPLLRFAALLVQAGLLAAAALGARQRGALRPVVYLLLAWLVPIVIPWAITRAGRAIFVSGRHDVYALGALVVLLALGGDTLWGWSRQGSAPRRRLAAAALVGVSLVLGVGVAQRLGALAAAPAPATHRATGQWLAAHAGPQDVVIAMGIRRLVSEHYLRLGRETPGAAVAMRSFPASTDNHPGWSDVPTLLTDEAALRREGLATGQALARQLPPEATVWILYRPYRRSAQAVSTTWLVDHHLYAGLQEAGWRRINALEDGAAARLRIAAYRRTGDGAEAQAGEGAKENRSAGQGVEPSRDGDRE